MRRRLLILCSAASLLLCVAVCALWAWTYRDQEAPPPYPKEERTIHLWGGMVVVAELHAAPGPVDLARGTNYHRSVLGFFTSGQLVGRPGYARYWGVQLWSPAVMCAALSAALALGALSARRADRLRRQSPNHCGACGYDLRATPQRCPECGAMPERPAPAA